MKVPIHAPGSRNGETGQPWRDMLPPPGKHWQYLPSKLDEMDARGEIFWSASGNPRRKVYLDEREGVPVQDIWLDMRDAHNQNIHITGYPTEKPQELLRRIVLASSNAGDLVLDCFAGSGTTLVVAQELGRRWIGVDNAAEGMRTILRRFAVGMEPMGDFVNRQKDDEPELSLALFENSETPTAPSTHVPISDFTLLAERGREAELKNVLAETTEAATPA
jgi:adenine-specific DNA-methyltransferase